MSKVKQWATDEAEKAVDKILSDVKSNIMSIDIARNKIMQVNNVNLTGIDEYNIDEVIDDFKNDTNIFCYVDAVSGKVIADYTKNGGTKIEY
jgi:hypothetical protein